MEGGPHFPSSVSSFHFVPDKVRKRSFLSVPRLTNRWPALESIVVVAVAAVICGEERRGD